MKLLERFDQWADAPEFNAHDLGRFRVVYALVALSLMPNFAWVSGFPFTFFQAPPGPFQLVWGIPGVWFFTALQALLVIGLIFVLFGLFTRTMSIAVAVLFTIGFGFAYSFGKIDHSFLVVLVPLMLGWAGWGNAVSIDSLRAANHRASPPSVKNYPIRLLAVLIGFAFLTATLPKVLANWLSFETQATVGYIARSNASGGAWWFPEMVAAFEPRILMEVLDWGTIIVEGGLILAAISWRSFRVWCAFLVLFHVGVALALGIYFIINLMAYGAFVKWSVIPMSSVPQRLTEVFKRWAHLLVPAIGIVVWVLIAQFGNVRWISGPLIVAISGVIAVWYLGRCTRQLFERRNDTNFVGASR